MGGKSAWAYSQEKGLEVELAQGTHGQEEQAYSVPVPDYYSAARSHRNKIDVRLPVFCLCAMVRDVPRFS